MNPKTFILLSVFLLLSFIVQAETVEPNALNANVLGEWATVDFVKDIDQFDPAKKSWQGELTLKGLAFEKDSTVWWYLPDNYRHSLAWEPGKMQTTFKRSTLYQIKTIGGVDYLFLEWISGDVVDRGMKPFYYVLKKGPIKNQYTDTPRQENFTTVKPADTVDFYDDVRFKDLSNIQTLNNTLVKSLKFNQNTVWPQQAVAGKTMEWFADKTLESAMNPGLGVRRLHKMGITGEGINVAIIDQPMYLDHPEFKGKIAAYHDVGCGSESSMHGPAVASLLVGENCGTAPGARVYYVAAPSWTRDTAYQAKALEWVIQQNRQLPDGQKIRVVSVSAAPSGHGSPFDKNNEMWDEACRKAETEGIMVLDCTDSHRGFISPAHFIKNQTENPVSCAAGFPKNPWQNVPKDHVALFVPTCPRTVAEEYEKGKSAYAYWGQGGLSWAIPYTAGVLAMGWQIWPEATPEQMTELLFQSAYIDKKGAKIINPPQFINYVKKAQKAGMQ